MRKYALALIIFCLDYLSKALAVNSGWTITPNYGLPFSIGLNSWLVLPLTATALAVIFFFVNKFRDSLSNGDLVAYNLIIGGAAANFADRVIHGYVRDFLHLANGIFNLADFAIFAGIVILLLNHLQSGHKDKIGSG